MNAQRTGQPLVTNRSRFGPDHEKRRSIITSTTMSAKRRLTVEERVAKKHREAHQLQQKSEFDSIMKDLKKHMHLVPAVRRNLNDLIGMPQPQQQPQQQQAQQAPSTPGVPALADGSPTESPARASSSELVAQRPSHWPAEISDTVPHRYTTLGESASGLSLVWLQFILAEIEPAPLSLFAQRALAPKRGQHGVAREESLRILEFITLLPRRTNISGHLKRTHILIAELKNLNQKHGRRVADLILTDPWDTKGTLSLEHRARVLFLKHRFMGMEVDPLDRRREGVVENRGQRKVQRRGSLRGR